MALDNWDPLASTLSSELASSAKKREIKNILKSYTGWFDLFSELIQNALDAIDKRQGSSDKFIPTIWITINIRDNVISVTDNGIGFSEDEFRSFLAPNITFKREGERGNKGVGATYLAYGFNFLQIGTKRPAGFKFIGEIKGGREWIEDDKATTRPKVQKSKLIDKTFEVVDQGATFSLKLVGESIHPKDLKWVGASTADQWEIVLRAKTPLGGIYWDSECLIDKCKIRVIDDKGVATDKEIIKPEYVYPHFVFSACKDIREIKRFQQKLLDKGKDTSDLPDRFKKLNGLYGYWKCEDIQSEKGEFYNQFDETQRDIAKKHNVGIYGFSTYTTDIWDKYNDEIVGLRKGSRILRGGLQLAANRMPQGELLIIPLTKNVWYQDITYVLIHFTDAEPDLGRKGFQPQLLEFALHAAGIVVKRFQSLRKLLKTGTGASPDVVGAREIHDWIREQEDHEKQHPLKIKREDLFLPMRQPAMTSEPLNEQDVISLFNQLLAGGVVRGIRLMATSPNRQYDSIFRFYLKKPLENHLYDKKTNPLGVWQDNTRELESAPAILEYKYSFDSLFEDIAKEEKNERDISLVVAWKMGSKWSQRYEVTPLLHFDNIHHRFFHGGTHIIKDGSTGSKVFDAIILSELIAYINDPDSVQKYQEETYLK